MTVMTIKSFLLSPWLTGLCHGERHRIALCLRHGRTRRNGQQGQLRTNNHQEPGKYAWTRILDKELLQICCWVGYKMVQSGVFFSACVRILHSRTAFFPLARLSQPFGQCLKPLQITDFYIFFNFRRNRTGPCHISAPVVLCRPYDLWQLCTGLRRHGPGS